ncbi:MAG TPA: alpha/beta fold hydrolase [Fimbriimonadales bacterium]|nr:alpha/beta fold hydrolase [Fimbriimonadales bacterium]
MTTLLIALAVGGGVYLLFLFLVAWIAIHPPRSPIFLSPSALGAPTEEIEFESDGLKLRGWWVPHPDPRGVFVLAHGYVMNRSENAALAARFYDSGFSSLLFDSRGCGKSEGTNVGFGWLERIDVLNALRFAAAKAPNLPKILLGSSMGAAACAFALAEEPSLADGLVLDSSYHDLPSATSGWWNFLGGKTASVVLFPVMFIGWLLTGINPYRVNVGDALKKIDKKILILHGKRDVMIPPFHAVKNHEVCSNSRLIWSESAGHAEMRWIETERYIKEVMDYVREIVIGK